MTADHFPAAHDGEDITGFRRSSSLDNHRDRLPDPIQAERRPPEMATVETDLGSLPRPRFRAATGRAGEHQGQDGPAQSGRSSPSRRRTIHVASSVRFATA